MSGSGQLIDAGIKACYGIDDTGDNWAVVKAVYRRGQVHFETLLDPARMQWDDRSVGVQRRIAEECSQGQAGLAGCMRSPDSMMRWLDTPLPSVAKARQVLPSLLDIQLPFPLEESLYDVPVVRRDPEGPVRALAVAVRKDRMEARLGKIRESGWDPVLLDHEGLALWDQAVEERPPDARSLRIVIYLGRRHTSFVVGKGEDPLSAHGNRVGIESLSHPSESGGARNNLAGKITRVLTTHRVEASERPVQWTWVGPGAEERELTQSIQDAVRLSPGSVTVGVKQPALFLARALAVRGLVRRPTQCNLRKDGFLHPYAISRDHARSTRAALVYGIAGLFLVILNLCASGWLHGKDRAYQSDLTNRAKILAPGAHIQKGQEVRAVEKAQAALRREQQPIRDLFSPSLTGLLNELLEAANAVGLVLDECALGRSAASVSGSAGDWDRCEVLAERLKAQGYDVSVDRQDAGADERVHFTIKGVRGP